MADSDISNSAGEPVTLAVENNGNDDCRSSSSSSDASNGGGSDGGDAVVLKSDDPNDGSSQNVVVPSDSSGIDPGEDLTVQENDEGNQVGPEEPVEELEDWEKELQDVLEKGEVLASEEDRVSQELESNDEPPALSPEEWRERLDAVLDEGVDYGALRSLCRHCTKDVPGNRRLDVWKVSLGLSRKSDAMQSWDGSFECLDRDAIEEQCCRQVERLPEDFSSEERDVVCKDMRSILTVYSKSTGQRFRPDGGWPELMLVIATLRPSKKDAYNILYTIMQKYIPKDCRSNGKPFHLFRLLLLYHDVELCNFLDTRRVNCELYLQKWLRALFAASCTVEVVQSMLDIYLLEADPFLVFFLALVMLMNAKEMLMDGTQCSRSDLADSISLFPSELGRDDLEDFCLLAQHYASLTPQSFRMDYHAPLFGPMKSSSVSSALPHALCLPVGLTELVSSLRQRAAEISGLDAPVSKISPDTAVSYFVVDCRPLEQYRTGRLLFCHHLDSELMLRDVSAFQRLVSALQEVHARVNEGEDHWCFIGTGRESEDQYMHMAVAHVLQRGVPYVSVARGGYAGLQQHLWSRVQDLLECDGADAPRFPAYNGRPDDDGVVDGDGGGERLSRSSLDGVKSAAVKKVGLLAGRVRGAVLEKRLAMRERAARMQERIADKKSEWKAEAAAGGGSGIGGGRGSVDVDVSAPAFSIDGEDDFDVTETLSALLAQGRKPDVNTGQFCAQRGVMRTFAGSELKEDGYMVTSLLVLTTDTLFGLRELASRSGWSEVHHQMPLSNLVKITSKKKHPELLTFHLGTVDRVHMTVKYLVPQAREACQALKSAIMSEMERSSKPDS